MSTAHTDVASALVPAGDGRTEEQTSTGPWVRRTFAGAAALTAAAVLGVTFYWNQEPAPFDVEALATEITGVPAEDLVAGTHTMAATLGVARTLLEKPGGYLTNDIVPPTSVLDNMPSWEMGVLTELRDTVRALRNDFSRAQTQSPEDPDLAAADPQFHFDARSWILPASEEEYARGVARLESYLTRLHGTGADKARFHVRADSLNFYLATVEKRLGGYSQRLAESAHAWEADVDENIGTDRTPWLEVDNVFFESRGYAWALLHTLRAIERDFYSILAAKNASIPMRRIIDKLERTQASVWSPVIMNNSGFGLLTNHSLVMASYLSRANAALIDLRILLSEG